MGFYINPPNETKESFLKREGLPIEYPFTWDDILDDYLPVILINNGVFNAAGIAYCEDKLNVFCDPRDPRPKKYFVVKIDKLYDVSPIPTDFVSKNSIMKKKPEEKF